MAELIKELAFDIFASAIGVTIVGLPLMFTYGIG